MASPRFAIEESGVQGVQVVQEAGEAGGERLLPMPNAPCPMPNNLTMFTATRKMCNVKKIIQLLISSIGTAIIISGCSADGFNGLNSSTNQWKTYKNPRYGFEFPYPKDWQSFPVDNNDGVTITAPKKPDTEIRAWATKELPEIQPLGTNTQTNQNFETAQGMSGVLTVETNQKTSAMKLTINHQNINYYWQAKTNHQDFKTHYPLFSYIAREYKIQQSQTETGKTEETKLQQKLNYLITNNK
ncbi:MAG: hypothetical protein EAZ76_14330 [Nostocales cyanobacterium]|nr:MAG: hypothetical protein EAZ87_10460 [Nostocales cyanobacterium]TAF12398.1 MAG: hypothetical protein EAZ76_14330 [Nostocales cyanobacterium]